MTAQEEIVIQQFINHRNIARSAPQKQAQALATWDSCALHLMYFEVLGLQRCLSFPTQRKVIGAQRDDPIRDTLVQSGGRDSVTRLWKRSSRYWLPITVSAFSPRAMPSKIASARRN